MKEKIEEETSNNINVKLSLKLNNQRYSPSEEVECLLIIKSNQDTKLTDILKHSECILILKEKIAYKYSEKDNETYIIDKKSIKFDKIEEKEDMTTLKLPIKYKIPDVSTKNFFPSFRYFSDSFKCIINHSICVEIPFISNNASANIFIRKTPLEKISEELNKSVFGDEFIKKFFLIKKGRLTYMIRTKKTISYKEKLPVEIHIDERELGDNKIESVDMKIIKHIYLFNELNIYSDYLEESFDQKKIFLKDKNIKNNTIIENFLLPEKEFIPISTKHIHKIDFKKDKFNFTPPVENDLFKCEYCLRIVFNFNKKFIKDKTINIPIDYYDPEFDNKINDNKKDEEKKTTINQINDSEENNDNDEEFNEVFRKTVSFRNKNIIKKDEDNNVMESIDNGIFGGFVDVNNEDIIKIIDGKKI